VECTGATEAVQCDDKACKQSTGQCTDVARGTQLACQPCEADSECVTEARCVQYDLGDDPVGTFCFFVDGATSNCADMDSARRPYSKSTTLTSVDGVDGDFLPITTCSAVQDATGVNPKNCLNTSIPDSSMCGVPNLDDGQCATSGAAMGTCSYQCDANEDCPSLGSISCSGAGADKFCQP